jgi:proline iminopeptidase
VSYGGFLALGYALIYPDRISALILRNTWAYGYNGTLRALKNVCTSPRIQPDLDRQVRLWSGNVRDDEDGAKGLAEILAIYAPEKEEHEETGPTGLEDAGDEFKMRWEVHNAAWSFSVPRFDVRKRLHEIKVPTLVIAGRHDPICPVEDAEEIHGGVSNSEMLIFERSGHNPVSDEPVAFEKALRSFIGKTFESL